MPSPPFKGWPRKNSTGSSPSAVWSHTPRDPTCSEKKTQASRLYIVAQGSVRIGKIVAGAMEEAMAFIERGGCFGEMALFDEFPRSATTIVAAEKGPSAETALRWVPPRSWGCDVRTKYVLHLPSRATLHMDLLEQAGRQKVFQQLTSQAVKR